MEVAQEHLERQNTEAATLERRKIVKSERLKSLEKKAAAALEKLEAATAEAREAAAREAAARGDLAFLAFVADPKTAAATSPVGNSVSDPEIRDIKMRPGMRWLIESMNRTVLMFDADEDKNDEDGMSVDWPEQHPDRNKAVDERVVPSRVHRFETVRERVTRARASLPRGLPKSVPGIFSAAKSLGKRPGELRPGLPPGLPQVGATSSSSEPEEKVFVEHL